MKIIILSIMGFLFSCNKSSDAPITKEGTDKILAVYIKRDSSKFLDILIRQITKTIKYDSSKSEDVIVVDTLWGYPALAPLRDSLGKVMLDKLNKPRTMLVYALIGKDSVNWKVQGIPVDSLLKRNNQIK